MTSNAAITVKNEKICLTTGIPGIQEIFSNNVTSDIDSFTDEPVVQCDVCRKYFLRWFWINDTNDSK